MKRLALAALLVGASLAALAPASASAAYSDAQCDPLDARFPDTRGGYGENPAFTVVAIRGGYLAQVKIKVENSYAGDIGTLRLRALDVDQPGDVPVNDPIAVSETILGSAIPVRADGGPVTVTVHFPNPPAIPVGTRYAIEVSEDGRGSDLFGYNSIYATSTPAPCPSSEVWSFNPGSGQFQRAYPNPNQVDIFFVTYMIEGETPLTCPDGSVVYAAYGCPAPQTNPPPTFTPPTTPPQNPKPKPKKKKKKKKKGKKKP